ncbi:Mitochondrial protein cyt-4 [Lachnellula willkommii]|uniref:Mitochondrial protein cyt-4 n=1 Tax=Lachnellula willkommii TaxID=215461 RepID=A0A559MDS8_9HELO|nr:Mitochondrial protein cyt-4 [Lachnellula willkommii]
MTRLRDLPVTMLQSFKAREKAIQSFGQAAQEPDLVPFPTLPIDSNIRKRLREWETANAGSFTAALDLESMRKEEGLGDITNSGRTNSSLVDIDPDTATIDQEKYSQVFEQDELVDVGLQRTFLLPGDLVELRFGSGRTQELAIYIRELDAQGQFYTMSGQWAHRQNSQPKFYVPGFVQPHELEELLPYLPQTDVIKDMEDKLHQFTMSLPRSIGKNLLKKMNDFWNDADTTYLAAASRLENAHRYLSSDESSRYATLDEIADVLLDNVVPKDDNGTYSKPDLYAVHRAILRSDIGFRIQPRGTLRSGGSYEILSQSEVFEVGRVTKYVRNYAERLASGRSNASWLPLLNFVRKSQRLIDESRLHREFTPHGTIGPSTRIQGDADDYRSGSLGEKFTPTDQLFIKFIESWACLGNFNIGSSLNGMASSILRSIGRYDDSILDRKAGWTFLQEIGAIPPWASQPAYELRLPFTGGRRLLMKYGTPHESCYTEDKLVDIRKDWGELHVFCIDQADAHEIDDGISVEATETPDEYWAHIHVADPSSHLDPNGGVVKNAERMVQSIYHPERFISMLNPRFVDSKLSLAPDRPCLTFSARLNMSGQLLEHKVSAGIMRNVVYISPSVFEEVASGRPESAETDGVVRFVGSGSTDSAPSRSMSSIKQLSDEQKRQLKILHQIGMANAKKLQSRGGFNQGRANFDVSVDFDGAKWRKTTLDYSTRYYGDPTIKLVIPEEKNQPMGALGYIMQLAGEVCAMWCSARGIPIPYRVTPFNPDKQDPAEYFSKVLLPSRNEEGIAPPDIARKYFSLIGAAQPSLTPGPHMAVGAEMLTKCTSPLRRFPDLLVHAQVGATLLEEARLGKSLVGNTNDDFLPYSADRISALLPQIDTRERSLKKAETDAKRVWLNHFLVRAWRFKQTELPPTLNFSVTSIDEYNGLMGGSIEEFMTGGQCLIPDWLDAEDIKPDDKFEVEIADVDVYFDRIVVKALRRVESPESV